MPSGIAIRAYRQTAQDVCPWNRRFASALRERAFAAREALDRVLGLTP